MKKASIVLLSCLFLTGCPSHSGVVPIGPDTYMISKQAATGFSGLGNLKAVIMQEGYQFCGEMNKKFEIVNTFETAPPYIFGNFPRAEIQFMCLDKGDPELVRPKMEKMPDTVIKVN